MQKFQQWLERKEEEKICCIIRGVSGGGKSSKIQSLFRKYGGDETHIFSTDNFWIPHARAQQLAGNPISKEDELEEYRRNWTPSKLGMAHQNNFENFKKAVNSGMTPVIVDNTNITHKDFRNYLEYATQMGYKVTFEEPDSPWWNEYRPYLTAKGNPHQFAQDHGVDLDQAKTHIRKHLDDFAEILAQKNTHGVPLDTIKKMIDRWEDV